MTFGLRREIHVGNTKYLIIQKAFGVFPACIGVNPKDTFEYVIVRTSDDKNYEFIDNPGESDGFESYQGAEQFCRAHIQVDFPSALPHRFYLNEFTNGGDGSLIDKNGKKVWF